MQEPDYGSLYEGRNPGFYVEANQMPTFKVPLLSLHIQCVSGTVWFSV